MNLIERLGGYEETKKHLDSCWCDDDNKAYLLENLLEYRRQHNIFEKGDWVFYEITGCVGDFVDHIKLDLGHPYCMVDFGLCDVGLIMLKNIRHATDAEIAAGKRLEVDNG